VNQFATVITQCLASGAIFTSLCAALIVPPLAWLGVRALTPTIAAMSDDSRWQATLAASAALLPGSLFLVLVVSGIVEGVNSQCLQLTAAKVLYGLLALLVAAAIVRALVRAHRRDRQLRRLLGNAAPATGRAGEIAREVGVLLFQVGDESEILVAAVGTPKAGVYISTGAMRQFDDAELRAALFHERAHIDRGDHRIAPLLYFITELLPLPVAGLVDVYRCSREFCADRCALAHVERTDLASALLRVARSSPTFVATGAAFAERRAMYGRLEALLRPKCEPQPNLRRRRLVAAALCSLFAVGLALPMTASFLLHCDPMRLVS